MLGRVLSICDQVGSSTHWAVKAFDSREGKKIIEVMRDHAKKRESNAKLLESIEDAIRELLGNILQTVLQCNCKL